MFNFSKDFVTKIINKDKHCFSRLYTETVDTFFRYLKSNYFLEDNEVEDILSDVYYKVWNWLDKINHWDNFEAWVWRIFKNTTYDYFKKNKETNFSNINNSDDDENFEDGIEDSEIDLTEFLENEFKYEHIKEAMEKLDDISKDIIFLKFIEEKSYEEISNTLWIKYDTVRQRISRAIKKLRSYLL